MKRATAGAAGSIAVVLALAGVAAGVAADRPRPRDAGLSGLPGPAGGASAGRAAVLAAVAVCPDLLGGYGPGVGSRPDTAALEVDGAGPVGGTVRYDLVTGGSSASSTPPGFSASSGPSGSSGLSASPGLAASSELLAGGARRASVALSPPAGGPAPVEVTATGPDAGAVAATVTTRHAGVVARAGCVAPSADTWFVGPGTQVGTDPLIQLVNPGPVAARADVIVLGPADPGPGTGPSDGGSGGGGSAPGVGVPARSTVTLRLAAIAAGDTATAVRVTVREGRLAAFVLDRDTGDPGHPGDHADPAKTVPGTPAGGIGAGVRAEDVPAAGVPGSFLLLPGLAGGAGSRQLVLAAPVADATVRVEIIGPDTRFRPVGLDAVPVAGGTVTRLELGPAPAADSAVAVTVTAGGPVLAALGLTAGPGTNPGVDAGAGAARSWLAPVAADPVTATPAGPAPASPGQSGGAFAVPSLPGETAGELVLASAGAAGSGSLDGGPPVAVPADRTATIALPAGYPGGVLTVSGGPLGVAQILRAAAQSGASTGSLTAVGLAAAAPTVPALAVTEDPRVALTP